MATSFRRRTGTIMQQIVEEILEAYHAAGPTGDPHGDEDLLTEICMETVGTVGSDTHLNILAAAEYTSENLCQEFGRDALDLGSALMMAAEGYVYSEVSKRLAAEAEAEVSHHEQVLGSSRHGVSSGENPVLQQEVGKVLEKVYAENPQWATMSSADLDNQVFAITKKQRYSRKTILGILGFDTDDVAKL